jgi:cytochrome oxidase assembly protein ShyY1
MRIAIGRREFSPSWSMTLLTAAALLAFIALGRWQWERGVAKDELASQFAQGGDAVTDLGPRGTLDLPRYTQVRVRGEWVADRQFLLDNRTRDGRAGYEVLTPLQLEDGREVLVNRGWIPFGGRRDQLPEVASGLPTDPATVQGRLDDLPTAGLASGRAAPALTGAWPRVTSFPSPTELEAAAGSRLEPRVLLMDAAEPTGYRRDWQPFARGPETHFGYALQWWSFGVLLLVLYGVLNTKRRDDA